MRTRTIFDAYLIASYEIRTGKRGPVRERQQTVFAGELLRRMDQYDMLMTKHYEYDAAFNLGIDTDTGSKTIRNITSDEDRIVRVMP